MKTLKDLTPEILDRIPEYKAKAIEGVFDGGRYYNFDLEKAKKAIKWNYEKCGFKMPLVLVAENPIEQQYMFNCLNLGSQLHSQLRSQLRSQLDSQLHSQLHSQLDSQIRSQLYIQLDSQLDSQLYSQLRSQLEIQLRSQLEIQLHSQLGSQLESQLDSQLRSQLNSQLDSRSLINISTVNDSYLFTLNVYSDCYYTWYKFIQHEFDIPLSIKEDFEECFNLQRESGIYSCIFSKAVAVVCKYPKKIHQRKSGNFELHSIDQQSVIWGSLTGCNMDCYYIHGRNVSKDLFEKLNAGHYTFEDFSKEKDEEIKSASIAFLQEKKGDEYVFNFFRQNLKEVDTYIDNKNKNYLIGTTGGMNVGVYTLFEGEVNNVNVAYIRCYCPSTDRMFFLGVNSIHSNAKDAIASLYRVPFKLRNNIKYIQRQGERFSTVFDKKGMDLLKKMSTDDIRNTTEIKGDLYFKLITYEY